MNLILVDPEELRPDGTVSFRGDRRCHHLNQVLRSQPGDTLRLGLVNGPLGTGRLLAISPAEAVLATAWDPESPAPPATDLILALPRPIMLRRILTQAAAQGVGRIFLINANRVEKSFFQSSLLQKQTLAEHLRQGLEQAADTILPEVSIHPRFRPFVEDILPTLAGNYSHLLLAHPEAAERLPAVAPPPVTGHILLALGPEGGWVDFEVAKLRQQGLRAFSMGPRILRLETAAVAVLAQLDLLRHL